MLQNSNDKNLDKNFKLMAISAIVLLILFIYTIFKSSQHIQGSSYYIGIIFLFILLFLSLLLKVKQDKVKAFFDKRRGVIQTSAFDNELSKSKAKISTDDLNSNIQAVTSNVTFKDVAGIKEIKEELEEVVDFLNNPKKYLQYGIKLPKGVLYNVMPQEVEKNVAQTMSFYASAFRDIAAGKYTLKQTENYGKWLSIQQTFAHAATVQGQAALMQGRAAITNANANASYLKQLGGYYGALTSGQNMSNDIQRYYTDFMLGKLPLGKAESILRQTPYKHLLDLNIQQNEWSLNKLMQEPDLIRSLSGMYKSETSLTNKRVDSYDTDKFFERGESVTRMFKNVSDGISNFTPKPRFKHGSSEDAPSAPLIVTGKQIGRAHV